MTDQTANRLSAAIEASTRANERIALVLELLIESMPVCREAELLGVSERTIRRRRLARMEQRLASIQEAA